MHRADAIEELCRMLNAELDLPGWDGEGYHVTPWTYIPPIMTQDEPGVPYDAPPPDAAMGVQVFRPVWDPNDGAGAAGYIEHSELENNPAKEHRIEMAKLRIQNAKLSCEDFVEREVP